MEVWRISRSVAGPQIPYVSESPSWRPWHCSWVTLWGFKGNNIVFWFSSFILPCQVNFHEMLYKRIWDRTTSLEMPDCTSEFPHTVYQWNHIFKYFRFVREDSDDSSYFRKDKQKPGKYLTFFECVIVTTVKSIVHIPKDDSLYLLASSSFLHSISIYWYLLICKSLWNAC